MEGLGNGPGQKTRQSRKLVKDLADRMVITHLKDHDAIDFKQCEM